MDNPLLIQLLIRLSKLSKRKEIVLCWIPSHTGIKGNEQADSAARAGQGQNIDTFFKVPYTDLKNTVTTYIKQKWQSFWTNYPNNKLFQIKPKLGVWKTCPGKINRKEEVILTRLHIGHSKLTHSYLLQGDEKPTCIPCQTTLSIKHILTECIDFLPTRKKYYKVCNMKELFENVNTNKIMFYLKKVGIYNKI